MSVDSGLSLSRLYALGNRAYQRDDDLDRAIDIFWQVLARAPRWEKARAKLGGLLLHRGRGRAVAGDLLGAVGDMRDAYHIHSKTPKLEQWFRQTLLDLASNQISQGRFSDATATLEDSIAVSGSGRRARELRAFLTTVSRETSAALRAVFEHLAEDRYESAADELRRLIQLEPGAPFPRQELGSLLFQMGREAARNEDWETALIDYEEASALIPDNEKLQPHLTAGFRHNIRKAITRGDFGVANKLVDRALNVTPNDKVLNRFRNVLTHLPTEPFDSYSEPVVGPDGARLPDLILVEAGVDTEILRQYLGLFDKGDVFAEFRYRGAEPGLDNLKSLLDVQSVGEAADQARAEKAMALAGELHHVLVVTVKGEWSYAELDLLACASYELEDVLFLALRELEAFRVIADATRYGRVVLIAGNGGLSACVDGFLRQRFGGDRYYVMWCSQELNRYDVRAHRGDSVGAVPAALSRRREFLLDLRRWWARLGMSHTPRTGPGAVEPAGSARVLLLPSHSSLHVSNVTRIAEHLLDSTSVVALLVSKEKKGVYAPLRHLGERSGGRLTLDPLNLSNSAEIWREYAEASASSVVVKLARHPTSSKMTAEGLELWPLLSPRVKRFLKVRLPALRAFAEAFDRRLQSYRPSALVVSPDRTSEARLACQLARKAGVVSIFPQPGLVSDSPRYKPLQADHAFVVDDFSRQLYLNLFDTHPSRVRVTGSTRLDVIAGLDAKETALRPVSDHMTVLLALQRFSVDYTKTLIGIVAEAVASLANVRLLIRMHPGDPRTNQPYYEAEVSRYLSRTCADLSNEADLYEQILGSDLVVSTFSTVMLESALLSRPVLCVNLTGQPLPVPFVEQGLAEGAETRHEVGESIRRLLSDEEYRHHAIARQSRYFSKNSHLKQGKAAARIAKLIHELSLPGSAVTYGS